MTVPLKHVIAGDIEQMVTGDFERFRYNLRRRFALEISTGGVGAIVVSTGVGIGTATNTISTQRSASSVSATPTAPGIGRTDIVRNYSQNSTGVPGVPTNFTESYVAVAEMQDDPTGITLMQQNNIDLIRQLIITPCIDEMRLGDEVGSYKVSILTPGTGWVEAPFILFQDTVFAGTTTNYRLWIRTSVPNPPGSMVLPQPLKLHAEGLEQHSMAEGSSFETFMYELLQNRLTQGDLTYTINMTEPTTAGLLNRGTFMDTRRIGDTPSFPGPQSGDDYQALSTPTGDPMGFDVYYLGMT